MVVSLNKNYRKIKDSMCFLSNHHFESENMLVVFASSSLNIFLYTASNKPDRYSLLNLFHWYLLTQCCVAETCVWRLKWMCAENLLKLGVISLCKQWRCLIWYMWTSRMILLAVINRLVLGLISAMSKHLVHKYKVLSTCPQNKTLTIRFGRRNSVPPPLLHTQWKYQVTVYFC